MRPILLVPPVLLALAALAPAQADDVVYRCPGNTFTNSISARQAESRGCKPLEGGSVTVIHGTSVRRGNGGGSVRPAVAGAGDAPRTQAGAEGERVSSADQKARDSDARRILEAELAAEQGKLSAMLADYNNGAPERQGDERNYQKYLDRVAAMKEAITRKESDIAAIKRELGKLQG